jgi:lysophospholipase L1-like esterase
MKMHSGLNALLAVVGGALLSSTPSHAQGGKPSFKIVHLGDSYSAGNGARDEAGEKDFYSVPGCYRSPSNWGNQFARSLSDDFAVTYVNRACSSGVVADMLSPRELGTAAKTLAGNCPTPDFPNEEYYVATSLFRCTRFILPQITAIDNSVDLVVMTMGGNDVKFEDIVIQCFLLGLPGGCEDAMDFAFARMNTLGQDLVDALSVVKSQLKPEARVVLAAYPHLLLDQEYLLGLTDSYDAGTAIRDLNNLGDVVQAKAMQDANDAAGGEPYAVFYDGTKALFATHEPDPELLTVNPDRWIREFFEGDIPEFYHFQPIGHDSLGSALSVFETFGAVGGSSERRAEVNTAASAQPVVAWFGEAVSGKVGAIITFDASGSFDPQGLSIDLYEWDFDGDGIFEFQTTENTATHIFNEAFNDFVLLRVTSEGGGSALASVRTVINELGFMPQGNEEQPCELDENGVSIFVSEDGILLKCLADSPPDSA